MSAGFNSRRPRTVKPISQQEADELVLKMRGERSALEDYRAKSLKLHGWICAKCAREFEQSNLHLLTVHHKDGNHKNNPSDGSNWENLCVYCHDDEHSRGILADYLNKGNKE
ncbi:YajD family HNH nuclease [Geomonas ferrireducens]|uniref:YajD family HNH nuclease n=1 Tax=Geomonas ferrireducens TaxID=2570227 RepID=UPI0010A92CE7|nr:YajD family HNH nuclease [Geomonas ferrireducens]